MSHLHTNDIDVAAIISPAATQANSDDATTSLLQPCSIAGCHTMCSGRPAICDECLDVLAGDVPMKATKPSSVKHYTWSGDGVPVCVDEADAEAAEAQAEAVELGIVRAPMRLRAEIFGVAVTAAEQSSDATPRSTADVDTTKLCATCVSETNYRCGCGKMCCRDCVDESGRCPGCDGVEAV